MCPPLIPHKRLVEPTVPIKDLDGGVVDPVLEAEEKVEVAEADIRVDGDDGEAKAGEGETDVGGGGGLADAALAGGDYDDSGGGARELGLASVLER